MRDHQIGGSLRTPRLKASSARFHHGKNISDEPTTFDGDNQTLINKKGQQFSPDVQARRLPGGDNTFLEEINPGNQVTGTIVFDIPKNTKPTKLLLKSGVLVLSEGVTVYIES